LINAIFNALPIIFLEFMDALTAPRAFRKSESMSQNKMRGLGIEESDSKNNMDNKNNILSHHQEAAKPRGKSQEK